MLQSGLVSLLRTDRREGGALRIFCLADAAIDIDVDFDWLSKGGLIMMFAGSPFSNFCEGAVASEAAFIPLIMVRLHCSLYSDSLSGLVSHTSSTKNLTRGFLMHAFPESIHKICFNSLDLWLDR